MAVTQPPAVDALPLPPQTSAPSTFSTLADAFIAALATFRTQLNGLAANVHGNATDAANNASSAATNAGTAVSAAATASAAAVTAVNAPGTTASSATQHTIGTGAKTLTIQGGKSVVPGMFLVVASTASPANWMYGQVTAYNSGTGQIDISVAKIAGAGTFAAWTVSLSAPPNSVPQWQIKTANYNAVSGDAIQADTSTAAWTLNLPAAPAVNDSVSVADYAGTFGINKLTIARNGSKIMGLAEDMTVSTNNVSLELQYIDATKGWRVV